MRERPHLPDAMVGSDVIEETVHISSCQREPLDDEVTDTDAEFAVERKCSRVSGSDAARSFSFSLCFFFFSCKSTGRVFGPTR